MAVQTYTLILVDVPEGVYDSTFTTSFQRLVAGEYVIPIGVTVAFKTNPLNPNYVFNYWQLETDYDEDGVWDVVAQLPSPTLNPHAFMSGTANIAFRITPIYITVVMHPVTFTSTQAITGAIINGEAVASGESRQFSDGSQVTIVVPAEVQVI